MIQPIHWPDIELGGLGKYNSPFQRGKRERVLKLTFHASALENLSKEDTDSLSAIFGLNGHNDLDYVTMRFNDFPSAGTHALPKETLEAIFAGNTDHIPQMRIRYYQPEDKNVPIVTWDGKKTFGQTFITDPAELGILASHLVGIDDTSHPKVKAMLDDLLIISLHQQENRDILVTTSPMMLGSKEHVVKSANPRTPTEAAKIEGLFLRSRNDYTFKFENSVRIGTNRGAFYWVLMRHSLPSMWRYYSGCVMAEDHRKDRTLYRGLSILNRCSRALEARDAIGIGFYNKQNNDTRDSMVFHFDYLTLLLAGAFDALARATYRVYQFSKPKGYLTQLQFRKKKYLKELKNKGANKLVEYVSQPAVQALLEIVYNLRNTIHGASLTSLSVKPQILKEEYSFITLSPDLEKIFTQNIQPHYDPDAWGLTQFHVLSFEPYTLASTLIRESFQIIDRIASETDITRLFPSKNNLLQLIEKPPEEDFLFNESTSNLISALG